MSGMRPLAPRWDTKTDAELAEALMAAQMLMASCGGSASFLSAAHWRAISISREMERRKRMGWEKPE